VVSNLYSFRSQISVALLFFFFGHFHWMYGFSYFSYFVVLCAFTCTFCFTFSINCSIFTTFVLSIRELFNLILSELITYNSASMESSFLQLLIFLCILVFQVFISYTSLCFARYSNCFCTSCCCSMYPLDYICCISFTLLQSLFRYFIYFFLKVCQFIVFCQFC
jgi:hypothetical protein